MILMMVETCTEWDESRRLVSEVLDRDEKLIKNLVLERTSLGGELRDMMRKMILATDEINARVLSGRCIGRVNDAPEFYAASIKKLESKISAIDNQIIMAREEVHEIADLIEM